MCIYKSRHSLNRKMKHTGLSKPVAYFYVVVALKILKSGLLQYLLS